MPDSFKFIISLYAMMATIALIALGYHVYIQSQEPKVIIQHTTIRQKGTTTNQGIDVFSNDGKHVGFGIHLGQTNHD